MHLLHAAIATAPLKGTPIHLFAAESGSEIFKGLVSCKILLSSESFLFWSNLYWPCQNTQNVSSGQHQHLLPGFSQTTPFKLLLRVFPVRLHPLESRHFSSIGSTDPIRTEEFQTEALRCLIAKLFQLLHIQLLTSGISPIKPRFKQRKYLKRHHWPAAVNPSNYSALSSRLCFIRAHLTWVKSCWSEQKVLKNWAGCLNDCEKEQESSFHFWTATVSDGVNLMFRKQTLPVFLLREEVGGH